MTGRSFTSHPERGTRHQAPGVVTTAPRIGTLVDTTTRKR